MSDRYTVHPHPGIVGGVYLRDNDEMSESGPLTPAEARRLAHALLDAIGERDEAAAIVRDLADADLLAITRDYEELYCTLCGAEEADPSDEDVEHKPTCPYLRARAFVAREGREETDHG